jgi:hypothetical protein
MSPLDRFTRRQFISTAAVAAGAAILPPRVFATAAQQSTGTASPPQARAAGRERIAFRVRPFPLKQVRLGEGPFKEAMEANRRYLHSLPPERLLHTFRLTAGLASTAEPLGGWESPTTELRGHFAGGHYLSACALMYASTGDAALKSKADAVVAELAKCQQAHKSGYLSAFPLELFDRLRDGVRVWAPFYTIHKIMAGHLDMYLHCGSAQALEVAEGMAGWVGQWTQPLSAEHMQRVLGTEFGGMGEVLCNLYAATGKRTYLELARRFDHKQFFDPLAAHRDELKGLHVNTQIPKVIAAARRYELTREQRYRDIADYFWNEVTTERAYCTGGTSNGEAWNTDPGKLSTELGPNTTENCCAYNMLKLTQHIFGWTAEARLMDYYERTLFNHRLGTINPEDGMTMYYLPLASGLWKTFGKPFDAFWCCTGTGAEEFAKLGDTIYFHDDDSLYVNLFIASELDWPEKGIRLRQETSFPAQQGTTLTVETPAPVEMSLHIRIPYWTRRGSVKVNGTLVPAFASPSSYLALNRVWNNGDKVEVSLPMGLHIQPMPDDESVQAVMYGPLVLAGRFEQVTKEMMYGNLGPRGTRIAVPEIVASPENPAAWLEPVPEEPLTFRAVGQSQPIILVPLYRILRERYAVYWKVRPRPA